MGEKMRTQIVQNILIEVAGSLSRRGVIRALTRVRHGLEREVEDGSVVPPVQFRTLIDVCRELDLTSFELIEVLGSTWVTDRAHAALTPEDVPIAEWNIWLEEHLEADLGLFEILGAHQ